MVFLGALACHLDAADPKIRQILARLVSVLSTPSEAVQRSVSDCLPPLMKLFLTKPRIWWKIMFGPFTMHQYLLQGPFANPRRAALVYSKQPVGDFLECSITAAFLLTAKVLSLLRCTRLGRHAAAVSAPQRHAHRPAATHTSARA